MSGLRYAGVVAGHRVVLTSYSRLLDELERPCCLPALSLRVMTALTVGSDEIILVLSALMTCLLETADVPLGCVAFITEQHAIPLEDAGKPHLDHGAAPRPRWPPLWRQLFVLVEAGPDRAPYGVFRTGVTQN